MCGFKLHWDIYPGNAINMHNNYSFTVSAGPILFVLNCLAHEKKKTNVFILPCYMPYLQDTYIKDYHNLSFNSDLFSHIEMNIVSHAQVETFLWFKYQVPVYETNIHPGNEEDGFRTIFSRMPPGWKRLYENLWYLVSLYYCFKMTNWTKLWLVTTTSSQHETNNVSERNSAQHRSTALAGRTLQMMHWLNKLIEWAPREQCNQFD